MRRALALLTIMIATLGVAHAGTMSIAWDPVSDADLAGYKVYYGTSPGTYTQFRDAGNTTSYTLTGLDACTRYYVTVKAYDTGGLESTNFSNEIAGLPRPVVSSVSPTSGEQGASLTLTVLGESFDNGATVEFSGTGISVLATRRDACDRLSIDIQIGLTAAPGARDLTVMNPDRSFGTKASAFTVSSNAAPSVTGTTPAAGATDIAISVKPTVTFSEPMDPASITTSTVRLLESTGAAVLQAPGSPTLSADGRTATITPASNLGYQKTYRVNARGGATGVKDTTGQAMASDFTQSPGFTTVAAPDTTPPTVSSTSPADNATAVPVSVHPQVVFSEAMDPASITSSTVQLIDASGAQIAQAAAPQLSADHKTVTITPAANLIERARYRIRVLGGGSGVKDEAGNALASTYTQPNGFTTENLPPGPVTNNHRTDVK